MPKSYDVIFASSNTHKYEEAEKILAEFEIKLGFFQTELVEIQDDSLSKIALQKVENAYEKCKRPVIVEDDGLFIDSLSGFPGPYSSYIFNTIGNNGILKLIGDNRDAQFVAIIAFCDSSNEPTLFESSVAGTISKSIQDGGWGYDPIFIPEKQIKTYAELTNKNKLSHRYESLKKFANKTKVDDPAKEGDHIGPVVSETQFNKIQTLIKKGIDEGAKLVAGGVGKPDGLEKGYFVKPTVFADVNNQMEIARTEIFGPVLSIMPFETEEEAIKIANDTPYGLTNYIQTQDQKKANRVARKLRSGMVDVNGAGIAVDAPFGGYKHSGIGREAGAQGLEEFLEVKTVGGWKDN